MIPVLALLATTAGAEPVRHALVVGANDGGGVLAPLQYAERDAEKVSEVLTDLGEFDSDLITVLYSPTENDLRTALARHAAIAEEYDEDLFVFYYSGHADGVGLRIGDDKYFFETLKHDLRAIDADVRIGLLDACRSGAITRLKGAAVSESLFGNEGTVEGEAWLTASAPDELAQESENLRGGFFTHYLLSGLRGAADTDDGVVDLEELHRYTFDRVVASTGATGAGTQHPHFERKLTGYGDLGLTDVRRASALVLLQEGDAGQIAVLRMPDKTQLAEFTKSDTREMAIAVPPGKYLVRRRFDGQTYEASFGLNQGSQFRVESWGSPLLEYGTARGEGEVEQARIITYSAESRDYERSLRLRDSPVVAGFASTVIPGAGQWYNGQFWKGAGYFAVTYSLLAGVLFNPASDELGSGFWPMLGAGVWGASIADGIYNVHRRETSRPRLGGQVSLSGSFDGNSEWPTHIGTSADLMLREGVSIGLDRVGFTPAADGGWDAHGGTRFMLGLEGEAWRPAALVAMGIRHGRSPGEDRIVTRTVFSAGGNLRYYVVPRYFLELDARYENDGGDSGFASAIGFGLHLGR